MKHVKDCDNPTTANIHEMPRIPSPNQHEKGPPDATKNRRTLLQSALTLGLASVNPDFVMAADQPTAPLPQGQGVPRLEREPMTLEQRIADASFIFIGVPTRFRYVPEDAYKKYDREHDTDPEYLLLKKKENATHEAFRKYFDTHPGDPAEFRLRDEDEKIEGMEHAFLEFDLERIVFKRGSPSKPEMGTNSKRLYFELGGGEFRKDAPAGARSRTPWVPYLGKRVILLSYGYLPHRENIRLPFPQQMLVAGPNDLDIFPIPLSELSQVSEIAKRLGFIPMENQKQNSQPSFKEKQK